MVSVPLTNQICSNDMIYWAKGTHLWEVIRREICLNWKNKRKRLEHLGSQLHIWGTFQCDKHDKRKGEIKKIKVESFFRKNKKKTYRNDVWISFSIKPGPHYNLFWSKTTRFCWVTLTFTVSFRGEFIRKSWHRDKNWIDK